MSGPQARPFKGRLGFDANNDKVVNLADPTELYDGMNLRTFIEKNTVPPFDPTRPYPAGFIVEYDNRLFKSKFAIGNGPFNATQWSDIHAYGRWLRITGAYTAEAGDNLLVSTQNGGFKINLPSPADNGDIVTIVDEGFAKTYPITITTPTDTINNIVSDYVINSQDICKFIFLGGTWKVVREEKITYGVISDGVTLTPNSYNMVPSAVANKTVLLPPSPINGQWVTLVDATNDGGNYYTNVMGNGNAINGQASFVMNRNGSQATFVYDSASGMWKVASNQGERKMANTLFPLLPSQSVYVPLLVTDQNLTLPTLTGNGDWVEIVSTAQDGINTGSIVVTAPAGTYFRTDGSTISTSVFRITRRGRTLFLRQNNEWSVIQLENQFNTPTITSGSLTKNTIQVLKGSTSSIIYLPPTDSVQVGDTVTTQMVTDTGRIVVSVQNGVTETIEGQQTLTYSPSDYGIIVTYVYRGWDGAKNTWKQINHGVAYAQKSLNLADLPDKTAARTNLEVFSKPESDARFLPLHGTADNALQAGNADKLDGLHGYQYIKTTNDDTTAYDANTTDQTRYTTNVNTPDSTMWQIVAYNDLATGYKSQIAMNRANNQIAYRAYNGTVWAAWSRLDQGSNSATASKLQTARTITLDGDATGFASFDGSANIQFPIVGVQASSIKAIATTLDNGGTAPAWTKICTVVGGATVADDASVRFFVNPRKTGTGPIAFVPSDALLRVKSGNVTSLLFNGTNHELGYVTVSPGNIEIWLKTITSNTITTIHEISRNVAITTSVSWNSGQPILSAAPAGYIAGSNVKTYNDSYRPMADKLTTPRNITVAGSATGFVTFDGSADVVLNLSMVPGGTQFEISNVNGLQGVLDGKLSTTGQAFDSARLGGVAAFSYKLGVFPPTANEDPNTTIATSMLTSHANAPDAGATYWYIETNFYNAQTNTANRYQVAKQYNGGMAVFVRSYYAGVWTAWSQIATQNTANTFTQPQTINVPAQGTYLRNISGSRGVMFYQDASTWYLMKTASGDPTGTYDAQRPLYVTLATGDVGMSQNLNVAGNVTAYYSDKRLKENLKVIPNALETVKSWTGYTYNANAKAKEFGYDTDKDEIGLMAQDVQATTPEAVEPAPFDRTDVKGESKSGEHYLTLKYERLVPVLVEAIKEQDSQIQELKQQVASLLEAFQALGK